MCAVSFIMSAIDVKLWDKVFRFDLLTFCPLASFSTLHNLSGRECFPSTPSPDIFYMFTRLLVP